MGNPALGLSLGAAGDWGVAAIPVQGDAQRIEAVLKKKAGLGRNQESLQWPANSGKHNSTPVLETKRSTAFT